MTARFVPSGLPHRTTWARKRAKTKKIFVIPAFAGMTHQTGSAESTVQCPRKLIHCGSSTRDSRFSLGMFLGPLIEVYLSLCSKAKLQHELHSAPVVKGIRDLAKVRIHQIASRLGKLRSVEQVDRFSVKQQLPLRTEAPRSGN